MSGRMIKWVVEPGEYEVPYQPRMVIKAQPLAEFMNEATLAKVGEGKWFLYVDGSYTPLLEVELESSTPARKEMSLNTP
ncbi:UNVERIFIED_CONTAM: hypothetical protein Sangu_2753000 [Sesamum angustifolium]|uniref:Uncharacterized protein n=1 Tax=Sesamum angustifolium TaxID=2727405 RepID=A0AAW2IV80_9LAMI